MAKKYILKIDLILESEKSTITTKKQQQQKKKHCYYSQESGQSGDYWLCFNYNPTSSEKSSEIC